MKKIVQIGWFDPAGMMNKFQTAFDKHSEKYSIRNICFQDSSLKYPVDIIIEQSTNIEHTICEIQSIIDEADIIILHTHINGGDNMQHIMNDWDNMQINNFNIFNFIKDLNKPIIYYLNGSNNLRMYHKYYADELKDKYVMCSTPDLKLLIGDHVFYAPGIIDLDDFIYTPLEYDKRNNIPKIIHTPTDPAVKNTNMFEEAIEILEQENKFKFKYENVYNIPHKLTMVYKKTSHILLDHLQGYYGISSLEAAAQGCIPFINLHPKVKEEFDKVSGVNTIPFINVESPEMIKPYLEAFLSNPELLEQTCKVKHIWMKNNWQPKKLVTRMENYFDSLKNE